MQKPAAVAPILFHRASSRRSHIVKAHRRDPPEPINWDFLCVGLLLAWRARPVCVAWRRLPRIAEFLRRAAFRAISSAFLFCRKASFKNRHHAAEKCLSYLYTGGENREKRHKSSLQGGNIVSWCCLMIRRSVVRHTGQRCGTSGSKKIFQSGVLLRKNLIQENRRDLYGFAARRKDSGFNWKSSSPITSPITVLLHVCVLCAVLLCAGACAAAWTPRPGSLQSFCEVCPFASKAEVELFFTAILEAKSWVSHV